MTTYTAIPGTDIDTDSPVTESLMTKLRDNPIAITEKAAGAPQLANDYVTAAMIGADQVGSSEIAAGAVNFSSEINTPSDDVTLTSSAAGTVIPAGVYNLGRIIAGTTTLQLYGGATAGWANIRNLTSLSAGNDFNIQIVSDGVSVRLTTSAGAGSVQARRVAA